MQFNSHSFLSMLNLCLCMFYLCNSCANFVTLFWKHYASYAPNKLECCTMTNISNIVNFWIQSLKVTKMKSLSKSKVSYSLYRLSLVCFLSKCKAAPRFLYFVIYCLLCSNKLECFIMTYFSNRVNFWIQSLKFTQMESLSKSKVSYSLY